MSRGGSRPGQATRARGRRVQLEDAVDDVVDVDVEVDDEEDAEEPELLSDEPLLDELLADESALDEELELSALDDPDESDPLGAGEVALDLPRLSVLKKPDPLKVTPTG